MPTWEQIIRLLWWLQTYQRSGQWMEEESAARAKAVKAAQNEAFEAEILVWIISIGFVVLVAIFGNIWFQIKVLLSNK